MRRALITALGIILTSVGAFGIFYISDNVLGSMECADGGCSAKDISQGSLTLLIIIVTIIVTIIMACKIMIQSTVPKPDVKV